MAHLSNGGEGGRRRETPTRNPELENRKGGRAPYIACIFNLSLAAILFWLYISDQVKEKAHPGLSITPILIVVNALIPLGITRAAAPERLLSKYPEYQLEFSEQERKVIHVWSLAIARLLSVISIVDIIIYVTLVLILEISSPTLFVETPSRLVVNFALYFILLVSSVVLATIFLRRRYPELQQIYVKLTAKAKRGY